MIRKNSPEWHNFLLKLEQIKMKSNRDIMCVKCWQMYNYKQKLEHLKDYPDHYTYMITSAKYASEAKIC